MKNPRTKTNAAATKINRTHSRSFLHTDKTTIHCSRKYRAKARDASAISAKIETVQSEHHGSAAGQQTALAQALARDLLQIHRGRQDIRHRGGKRRQAGGDDQRRRQQRGHRRGKPVQAVVRILPANSNRLDGFQYSGTNRGSVSPNGAMSKLAHPICR